MKHSSSVYKALSPLMLLPALTLTNPAYSQEQVTGFAQQPLYVIQEQNFEIQVLTEVCSADVENDISYVVEGMNIIVYYQTGADNSCDTSATPTPAPVKLQQLPIAGLFAGTYSVYFEAYREAIPATIQVPSNREPDQMITIYNHSSAPAFNLESPQQGKVISGIGTIRGWACAKDNSVPISVGKVSYQIDDRPVVEMPYGSSRNDTAIACEGKEDTGFAATINWNNLPMGTHIIKFFIDNVQVLARPFSTGGPGESFITNFVTEYDLDDFPVRDKEAIIRWSEPDQNFIILRVVNDT